MNTYVQRIIVAFMSILILACGFQLRSSFDVNFKSIAISGGSPGLSKYLNKQFRQSGIKTNEKDPEKYLEIISDKLDKRILSLSSSGSVEEFELDYEVIYRFRSPDSEWSQQISIQLSRDYTYDDDDRVAKELEERNLINGMRSEIIRTIVNQMIISN